MKPKLRAAIELVGFFICHDFATVRLALIRFIERIRDFSSRDVSFYAGKAD